jgi:hypothetical protein
VREWGRGNGSGQGECLTVTQVWELAQRWYHDRLSPTYLGRSLEQIEDIFRSVGLNSDFWYLPGRSRRSGT